MIKIISYLNKKTDRSKRIIKSTVTLLFFKGISILINLALVPVTLGLLDQELFGIWITIFSIVNWLNYFDIGLGNGLRNRCAAAFARKDLKNLKEYISSAYVFLLTASLFILVLFLMASNHINWSYLINAPEKLNNNLTLLFKLIIPLFLLTLVGKLITNILSADLKPGIANSIFTLSNLIILGAFVFFKDFFDGSLVRVGTFYLLAPLLITLCYNFFFFSTSYRVIQPSLKSYNKSTAKSLLKTGVNFFIIQIAVLIVFQTDNLIIAHVLGPKEVTSYNIAFRYFAVISMSVSLLLTPLWSAYTNALEVKDYIWMKKTIKNSIAIIIPSLLIILILGYFHKPLITLWIGDILTLTPTLIWGMGIFTLITIWNNIFANFLNGTGVLKGQMITSILASILNIPLSIFLARIYGNSGVIYATIVCLLFFAIIGPLTTISFLNKMERSI